MPHTTSKVSERGHFILPELNLSFFHFLFSIINVKACKTLCLEGSVCATDLYWSKNHHLWSVYFWRNCDSGCFCTREYASKFESSASVSLYLKCKYFTKRASKVWMMLFWHYSDSHPQWMMLLSDMTMNDNRKWASNRFLRISICLRDIDFTVSRSCRMVCDFIRISLKVLCP